METAVTPAKTIVAQISNDDLIIQYLLHERALQILHAAIALGAELGLARRHAIRVRFGQCRLEFAQSPRQLLGKGNANLDLRMRLRGKGRERKGDEGKRGGREGECVQHEEQDQQNRSNKLPGWDSWRMHTQLDEALNFKRTRRHAEKQTSRHV
jgi:hypothetical protein